MSKTPIYWMVIVGLCVCFPPLIGLWIGIGVYFALYRVWFRVVGGEWAALLLGQHFDGRRAVTSRLPEDREACHDG